MIVSLDVALVVVCDGSSGDMRMPRRTKFVVPPVTSVIEEQAYGVFDSRCRTEATRELTSVCSRGAIGIAERPMFGHRTI